MTPAARNVISGNAGNGVEIGFGPGAIVQGNFIGTDTTGTSALGNSVDGIVIDAQGTNSIIGGAGAGEGNVIAFNGEQGVTIYNSAAGNSIRGNSIHDNDGDLKITPIFGLGIDLNGDGVTANDAQDADTGPNNLQNFPVITSGTLSTETGIVSGTLNSTPGQSFTLDFYANDQCDPTGYGEGQTYLGSPQTSATDSNGDVSFTFNFDAPLLGANQRVITATATDANGNTSEFSACFTLTVVTPPPAATHFSVSAPTSATAGTAFTFTVTALDQFNNIAIGYGGTVHFTSGDAHASVPSDSALANGTSTFSATLKIAGNQTISTTDAANSSINGTSNTIEVSATTHVLAIASYVLGGGGGASAGGSLGLTDTIGQHDAALSNGGSLTLVGGFFNDASLSTVTPVGSNVTITLGTTTITLAGISTAGTTTISPIDPNAQGTPPAGYNIGGTAYDISTTAAYTVPVTICFNMSSVTDPTEFANLKVLHNENGVLIDRTSSQDFSTKMVCAAVPSLSPFVIATLDTPRGNKQKVLDQLIALRAAVTVQSYRAHLDDAIDRLLASLNPALWLDPSRLRPGGGMADFEAEKEAVHKLRELMGSSITKAQLRQLIQLITSADRQLAQVAIMDARDAGGDQRTINRATGALSAGDTNAANDRFEEAISDYAASWQLARTATHGS